MALHAIDDVSDALPVTTDFLRGLSKRDWLLLAVVALLTGGASNTTSGGSNVGNLGGGSGTPATGMPDVGHVVATLPGWVWGVVALVVLLGLVLAVLGAILQFTFVEALCTGDVEIRRTVAAHWGKGVRLFLFNLVLGVVVLATFAVAILPLVLGLAAGALFLLLIPVAVLLALLVALVLGFTRAFVVPVMLAEDAGVLAAWRRFASVLAGDPLEYLVFAVVNFVLLIVLGIALGIAAAVVGIAVVIPVGIVFGLPFALAGASGALAWTWLGIGIVLGVLLFLLGIPSAWDTAWLSWFDSIAVNLLLPVAVLLLVLFVGWVLAPDAVDELRIGSGDSFDDLAPLWLWSLRTVVLLAVLVTVALSVTELTGAPV